MQAASTASPCWQTLSLLQLSRNLLHGSPLLGQGHACDEVSCRFHCHPAAAPQCQDFTDRCGGSGRKLTTDTACRLVSWPRHGCLGSEQPLQVRLALQQLPHLCTCACVRLSMPRTSSAADQQLPGQLP